MTIRNLNTEPTTGKVEKKILDTSSQRSKTLPILETALKSAIVKKDPRTDAEAILARS